MVYFDSWDDLKKKIATIDYEAVQKKIKEAGKRHRETELQKWRDVFDEAQQFLAT